MVEESQSLNEEGIRNIPDGKRSEHFPLTKKIGRKSFIKKQ